VDLKPKAKEESTMQSARHNNAADPAFVFVPGPRTTDGGGKMVGVASGDGRKIDLGG